ncbi:MAG: sigma-54 interaction domain-containing protein, partial [Caldisericum sp.]|uniref:sigma-54 interaction domain-containing protein n=1 Tax=Caldisericum sp. TaxID=2499687 RepID=UPI003D14B2E4
FVDKDGVVLLTKGVSKDPVISEGMIIGKAFGKTAIGIALQKCENSEVQGANHSDPIFKNWSCAASPLLDKKGDLVGIISVSALSINYPQFALETTSLIASAVQNEVNLKELISEIDFSKKNIEAIAEGNKDGVLVLDKNAKVLYINSAGASILRVNKDTAVNKNVSEIVDFTPVILNVFKTKKGYVDKEFIIESPSRGTLHFIKSAVVLKDAEGNFAGVIDFFREIERVRKFVVSYIGAEARFSFEDIIGNDPKIREAIRLARLASHSNSTVLLTGETGTGKEMFAQAIHLESVRSSGPFVALNCGAIPRDIAESEFFGYEPGSFTDADKNGRPGKFELANGGTLFLDEIEELPPAIQVKLLRVLEDRVITRIGGTKSIKVDVRIISASNKNLESLVESGAFREDLFYRLNVIQIPIPPLRERKVDIPLLVTRFLEKFKKELGKNISGYDRSFMDSLLDYNFPGNVRELQNIIERAVNIADSEVLMQEHIPHLVLKNIGKGESQQEDLDKLKSDYVKSVLSKYNFNISYTAKQLGISRPTLYKLIRLYKINKVN